MRTTARLLLAAALVAPALPVVPAAHAASAAVPTATTAGGHHHVVERPVVRRSATPVPHRTGTTFLVDTAPGDAAARPALAAIRSLGGSVVTSWPQIGVTVGIAPDAAARRIVPALRRVPGVQQAGLSGVVLPAAPRMPVRTKGFQRPKETPGPIAAAAQAPAANRLATGRGVTIGIADTGVLEETPDLAGRVDTRRSGSCVGGVLDRSPGSWRPSAVDPSFEHGTAVAAVAVAGVNGLGIRGVAPEATVVSLRVGDDTGSMYPEAAICAAMTAVDLRLPVENHSYGIDSITDLRHGLWDPRQPDQAAAIEAVDRAFAYSRARGVLHVAATGNGGEDLSAKPTIPLAAAEGRGPLPSRLRALLAEVPGVVGVGQDEPDGRVTFLSSVGLGVVDLASVGAGEVPDGLGGYQAGAGTSFAAPAVAGTAALVRQLRPGWGPAQLEAAVETSARPATCARAGSIASGQPCRAQGGLTSFFGHGRLDALAAVRRAG